MKESPSTNNHDHPHHDQEKLFIDPVCGMTTEDERDFTSYEYEGQSYYFCSDHCLTKFKEDPEKYNSTKESPKKQSKEYSDPVCGMSTDDPEAFKTYTHKGDKYFFCSAHCLDAGPEKSTVNYIIQR